jgi:hypothetical protein
MDSAIADYQKWKQQGESLRSQAKQAMESRFRELLSEAARLSQEYQADFGSVLKPPPPVTAFRFKAGPKGAAKRTAPSAKATPAAPQKVDPKIADLQKRLGQANKKLEVAKAAGKPTKNLEDKVYEVEDALKLALDNE